MLQSGPPPDGRATQHQGTEHLTVNDTWTRRALTRLALQTTARLFYRWQGPCVPVSGSIVVKSGPSVHLTEAATISFIAANTSIPVPRIYCAFVHDNECYIVMERIKGIPIAHALATATDEARDRLFQQLRSMIKELRALPSHGTHVESCVGGSLRDSRIPRSRPRFGPFDSVHEFHRWLREDLRLEEVTNQPESQRSEDLKNMINAQGGPWPGTVFTHGDLNPFNILVRGDQVVGIIDWEFAGWYPTYWEYTSAWCGNVVRPSWQDMLPRFLDAFPEELKMEITRQRFWGDLF
jgi:aminoglycoside phosphotransferase